MEKDNALMLFEGDAIRKIWHEQQWFFNIPDVIAILTGSPNPKAYWRMLKLHLLHESESKSISNCYGLTFEANDGKKQVQDAANTEGLLRIVMRIPSPNLEPLMKWLISLSRQNTVQDV